MQYRYMHLFVYVHILCTQVLFAESEFEIRLFKVISQLSVQVVLQSSLWMNLDILFPFMKTAQRPILNTQSQQTTVAKWRPCPVDLFELAGHVNILLSSPNKAIQGLSFVNQRGPSSGQLLETGRTTREQASITSTKVYRPHPI